MSHAQRLKDLAKSWDRDKPASGGRSSHPIGNDWQGTITKCALALGKKGKQVGHLLIQITVKGLKGEAADKLCWNSIDLNYPGRKANGNQSAVPTGIARFKGFLQLMELDLPKKLTDKAIASVCEKIVGSVVDYAVVQSGQYTNTYINRLVDAAEEIDDDDLDDDDELETEEEREQEEADDDDDDDDSEETVGDDDEFEEADPDEEEEEETPAPKRGRGRPKGSKNKSKEGVKKKKKATKKKASKSAEPETDSSEEWGDDWGD